MAMAAVGIGLGACSSRSGETKSGIPEAEVQAALAAGELPVPTVPESLATPEERAAYVALHFWDAMDWNNHALSLDTAFMEQNFANYLGILPYADENGRKEAIASLLRGAQTNKDSYSYLASVAEHYLADPNSPMRSEEIYMLFLNEFLRSPNFSDDKKTKYHYQLQVAYKNRPGTEASDFRMHNRNGKSLSLRDFASKAECTLLIFYDPDCEHCKEIMGEMREWKLPDEMQVLAVDVTGDADRFARTQDSYPDDWEVAFATEPIEDEDLYVFPALPSLYLLDKNGKVILKDTAPHTIAHIIGHNTNNIYKQVANK